MYLGNEAIVEAMLCEQIKIEPYSEEQLNPNSYDVRLDNVFYAVAWEDGKSQYAGPIFIDYGKPVYIPNGVTILGRTLEIIGTFQTVVAKIHAKSSTRRRGISTCDDAGLGDVGFHNHWTVELTAQVFGDPAKLIVGERFAQMVFAEVCGSTTSYSGQYTNNDYASLVPKSDRKNIIAPSDELVQLLTTGYSEDYG